MHCPHDWSSNPEQTLPPRWQVSHSLDRNTSWPCSSNQFLSTHAHHEPTHLDPNLAPLSNGTESLPNPPNQGVRGLVILHHLRHPPVSCLGRRANLPFLLPGQGPLRPAADLLHRHRGLPRTTFLAPTGRLLTCQGLWGCLAFLRTFEGRLGNRR